MTEMLFQSGESVVIHYFGITKTICVVTGTIEADIEPTSIGNNYRRAYGGTERAL